MKKISLITLILLSVSLPVMAASLSFEVTWEIVNPISLNVDSDRENMIASTDPNFAVNAEPSISYSCNSECILNSGFLDKENKNNFIVELIGE